MLDILEIIQYDYSSTEKERLKGLIITLAKLANKARSHGILSLENEYRSLNPFLLRKGIELVVEGCYIRDLRGIMNNYITTKKATGFQLLECAIIREGVLLIQNGDQGKILYEKVLSMLGEGFFENPDYPEVEEYDPENKGPIIEEAVPFEERIMSITDYADMEKVIRRSGYITLAMALKAGSRKVNAHVRNLISERYIVDELNQESMSIGPIRLQDGIDAQKCILSLL